MSSLKNYTSKVPASQSIGMIEKELVSVGATRIVKEYGPDQKIASIIFTYRLNGNDIPFLLPAKVEATYRHLIEGKKKVTTAQRKQMEGQAERTAWKNVYDWVNYENYTAARTPLGLLSPGWPETKPEGDEEE